MRLKIFFLAVGVLALVPWLQAQPDRLAGAIDPKQTVRLSGNVHGLASPRNDRGPVDPSFEMEGMVIYLKPSTSQRQALDQLLVDLQDDSSPRRHQWLTPEQYADRFGVSQAGARKIAAWLSSQGFEVRYVSRGRSFVVFRGTAAQVRAAFHTEIRRYSVNGKLHYANSSNPSIPAALRDLVTGIRGLHDFRPTSDARQVGPETTLGNGTHVLAPNDFATIYDIQPLYDHGFDGTGQSLAIIGQTQVMLSDIVTFRARFNLPNQLPQLILVPGFGDPGIDRNSLPEADLDLEWSGAVARNATIFYVYSFNAFDATSYAIDQNLAPVISSSFSYGCEGLVGSADLTVFQQMAQQANAQGISWINSSGDSGAAGCDLNGASIAQDGLATRVPASVPEVTAVGGTEFTEHGGTYWNATNDANGASALSYIPEMVWNDSAAARELLSGGGGASIFFPKPFWQLGQGVPDDALRDVPDIALSAAAHDPYTVITGGSTEYFYGTSASAPSFAGTLALLNQYLLATNSETQPRLGNINPALYTIARGASNVFHDITTGNNQVPCVTGSPNCSHGVVGYAAGPAYDLATGLGSPDVWNLIQAWRTGTQIGSVVSVSLSANPIYEQSSNGAGSSVETFTLTEEGGTATTLTGFSVDGVSATPDQIASIFKSAAIPAYGSITGAVTYTGVIPPLTRLFTFNGADAGGQTWSRSVQIPFLGPAPDPSVGGTTNAASYQQRYAPGMIMAVFGAQLAAGTQAAAVVPLLDYMQNFAAVVGNSIAPIYYVSPTQANVQIPYGLQPGAATLTIYNGDQVTTTTIQIATTAPGIFTTSDLMTTPYPSGKAGQVLTLFITGDGEVSPSLETGSAPSLSTLIGSLPQSIQPVSMTIGGVPADIKFHGIPYGLVGVTQINFVVPAGLAPGKQPVIVTVGNAASQTAYFNITQ